MRFPGPEIHVTGPYLQGQPGQYPAAMHPLKDPEDARRMVRYWAQEGVTWFKAYTTLTRAELGAAIDEAHKNGIKVTAHLCSVGFREAVELGIDNLEHGLLTNTEFYSGKKLDECPSATPSEMYDPLDLSSPDVKKTIDLMVQAQGADDVDARRDGDDRRRAAFPTIRACWTRCILTRRKRLSRG